MTEGIDSAGTERPQRLRGLPALRALVRETRLSVDDLVLPLFVTQAEDPPAEIPSMPGVFRRSVEETAGHAALAGDLGIKAVILFGIPSSKDPLGSGGWDPEGAVQRAVVAIKGRAPQMVVITDACFCEYTDHGHCGILDEDRRIDVGATLEALGEIALSQAKSGADVIAPSGMIDGMVRSIRRALDGAGFHNVGILSYAVKYASSFYGPFRDAADGAPAFGDRRHHQMDPANAREALREARLDVAEGADVLMVKPALAYLDVVWRIREAHPGIPLAAYNVSGEYALVKAASRAGWLDERAVVLESLTGMRRAGADLILTYHALDVARWLAEGLE